MPADIDTLLSLAREVARGVVERNGAHQAVAVFGEKELVVFAERIRQDERERAARICEERAGTMSMFASVRDASNHNAIVRGCAAAIRSSGTSQSNPLLGGGNG